MPWHVLEITLQGKTFTLRTESDPEFLLGAASDAENRLKILEAQFPGLSPHRVALLALLQACQDRAETQRALDRHRESVRQRARWIREALGRYGSFTEGATLPGEG